MQAIGWTSLSQRTRSLNFGHLRSFIDSFKELISIVYNSGIRTKESPKKPEGWVKKEKKERMFCAIKQHSNIEKKKRFHSNKEKWLAYWFFQGETNSYQNWGWKTSRKINKKRKEFKRKKSKREARGSSLSFFTTHNVDALFDPIQLKLAYYFFSH